MTSPPCSGRQLCQRRWPGQRGQRAGNQKLQSLWLNKWVRAVNPQAVTCHGTTSGGQMWTRYLLALSHPGSKDWHQAGRGSQLLCSSCQNYENKHGCLPRSAAFMFKPVKEEEEVNSKHGMRTRRSRAAVSLAPSNIALTFFFFLFFLCNFFCNRDWFLLLFFFFF